MTKSKEFTNCINFATNNCPERKNPKLKDFEEIPEFHGKMEYRTGEMYKQANEICEKCNLFKERKK